jgi:hypothetical protein
MGDTNVCLRDRARSGSVDCSGVLRTRGAISGSVLSSVEIDWTVAEFGSALTGAFDRGTAALI